MYSAGSKLGSLNGLLVVLVELLEVLLVVLVCNGGVEDMAFSGVSILEGEA